MKIPFHGEPRQIIAPNEIGIVPEFGVTPHILRYPAGDPAALTQF
jgi:hypothetical protein